MSCALICVLLGERCECVVCWQPSLALMFPATGEILRQPAALGQVWETAVYCELQVSAVQQIAESDTRSRSQLTPKK